MSSLAEYLAVIDSTLTSLGEGDEIHITVGNESCDLDSIVCAICHAHFLAQLQRENRLFLPVLQCSRDDLSLRTDAVWLLTQLELEPVNLLFMEEALPRLQAVRKVSVTLVDHATPTGPLEELPNMEIAAVIDHHPSSFSSSRPADHVVEAVGSCATLVAERLLGEDKYSMTKPVATLLLGAILLDTVGLEDRAGRVTSKDKVMAERLGAWVDVNFTELYTSLSEARLSVAGLSPHQLLRKDLKSVVAGEHRLGFSSVTCQLSPELLGSDDMEQAVQTVCQSHSLSALLLLGVRVAADSVSRELAIFQGEGASEVADTVASLLESDEGLQCRRLPSPSCILFQQGNPSLSRKHILPLVLKFMSSLSQDQGSGRGSEEDMIDPQRQPQEMIPEYTYKEESHDVRSHRLVSVEEDDPSVVDMDVIQPYKKIIQHGGYVGPERHALLVISACYLPPRSIPQYDTTVDHLFLYIGSVVQRLVVDDYQLVYLHSGAPQHSMPSFSLLRKFYHMLDHRLRKQLKHLYIVHPTFWVRSMLQLARPFISSKFYRKVHMVRRLDQLTVPLEHYLIPAPVLRADSAHLPHPSQPSRRYTTDKQL